MTNDKNVRHNGMESWPRVTSDIRVYSYLSYLIVILICKQYSKIQYIIPIYLLPSEIKEIHEANFNLKLFLKLWTFVEAALKTAI